jgi:ABC-type lipoprotein release transport system permease subunit
VMRAVTAFPQYRAKRRPRRALLYRVNAIDPANLLLAMGALLASAALTPLLPALRAMQVDPIIALPEE